LGNLARFCNSQFWEKSIDQIKFDRSTSVKIRSTFKFDRSTLQDFRISKHFLMKFVIPFLLTYKTQKLTKTSENNKAKGITNVNQGVKIHNIWHSSLLSLSHRSPLQSPAVNFHVLFLSSSRQPASCPDQPN